MPREDVGTAFVYCFLVRNKDRIADAGSGATFPEVSGKTMAGIELTLPDIDLRTEFKEWATICPRNALGSLLLQASRMSDAYSHSIAGRIDSRPAV